MSLIEVTAKLKDGPEASAKYDFGDNLDEAVQKFGPDAVYAGFKASAVIDVQGMMRSLLRRPADKGGPAGSDEIQNAVTAWEPGTKSRVTRSPQERITELMSRLTEDERANLLATLLPE